MPEATAAAEKLNALPTGKKGREKRPPYSRAAFSPDHKTGGSQNGWTARNAPTAPLFGYGQNGRKDVARPRKKLTPSWNHCSI